MFCFVEKSIYFCSMKSCIKETSNTDFVDIILSGGEEADEAMYNLLHQHLNHQLKQQFKAYHNQLLDDFEDIVVDFFLYLREGKEGDGQQSYQSLRCIEKRESFEPWILNTFRNYLSGRAYKEAKVICMELSTENVTDSDVSSSLLTDERMLTIASNLIAYAHQKLSPRDRFIFLRTLLSLLNKRQALPNESMAKALGMTDISYRVTVYRMKCHLAEYLTQLLDGECFRLDDKHQQMAQQINDDFTHLYPTLLGYYSQAIDSLNCSEAVKQLRQEYYLTTGDMMHEPEPSYSTSLTIEAFWNKLNRFLIV